jgi:uncharacterized membrane protein YhaH (DUF805 family)
LDVSSVVETFRHVVSTQYFQIEGRTGRQDFWNFVVACVALLVGTYILDSLIGIGHTIYSGTSFYPFTTLASLALLIPNLSIAIRRLHDTDRTAGWMLVGIVPFVGWAVVIYWFAEAGMRGENQFGREPKSS